MIPVPYGGTLVDRLAKGNELRRLVEEVKEMPLLTPIVDQIYDAEKLGEGAYSPLEGFMGKAEIESVVERSRLLKDLPWTMPIFLAPAGKKNEEILKRAKPSDNLAIAGEDGAPFAFIRLEERFPLDKKRMAEGVYGTTDPAHPNVGDLAAMGDEAISGKVTLLRKLEHPQGHFELTPTKTRSYFSQMGWRSVAGYQARNPPHTAHEYIQRLTLEREDVDAIFIQPVVGKLKKGDYRPEVIMRAYDAFVANYYQPERVLLGSLSISMRYAGPKAALFYAIVRRNYGCSHYIVGRDQAGVGSYYDPYACHRIFDECDVGVVPLRYRETFHCTHCGGMVSEKVCPHPKEARTGTSQTAIRKMLAEGKPLPAEVVRPEVAKVLSGGDVINP